MKLGAQQTLDELFAERLIPFALSAWVVDSVGLEEYIVRFHDSRLHSVDVSCPEGRSSKKWSEPPFWTESRDLVIPIKESLYTLTEGRKDHIENVFAQSVPHLPAISSEAVNFE